MRAHEAGAAHARTTGHRPLGRAAQDWRARARAALSQKQTQHSETMMIKCPGTFQNALGRSGTPLHMSPCDVRPEAALTSPDVSLGASGRTVE